MAYMLIDPPVSPLSSPEKIQAWLERLTAWAIDPRYSDPTVQKQIQGAMAEAREWLGEARAIPVPPTPGLTRPRIND
jgi:hypothetical protein